MGKFHDFCRIDLRLTEETIMYHTGQLKRLDAEIRKHGIGLVSASQEDLRSYLMRFNGMSDSSFSNAVKAMRRFYRDFLDRPDLVRTFKLPACMVQPKILPSRRDLQEAYASLDNARDKALFLLYATTGLRKEEIRCLKMSELNRENRMIVTGYHRGSTKRAWITFYNSEAEEALNEYLRGREEGDERVFTVAITTISRMFRNIKRRTGIDLTPQILREWFCQEMGELGVPDRFIDAFCGRTPKSVLARHYSDYSPDRLKTIYDKAGLKVLSEV
ncbi:MAG: tyrosine-type recombinase/integrase [Thaumarchaeota archaeon]|nr:tyrosine-type recombinase/integrase [Nitrososphaerota archaeon]